MDPARSAPAAAGTCTRRVARGRARSVLGSTSSRAALRFVTVPSFVRTGRALPRRVAGSLKGAQRGRPAVSCTSVARLTRRRRAAVALSADSTKGCGSVKLATTAQGPVSSVRSPVLAPAMAEAAATRVVAALQSRRSKMDAATSAPSGVPSGIGAALGAGVCGVRSACRTSSDTVIRPKTACLGLGPSFIPAETARLHGVARPVGRKDARGRRRTDAAGSSGSAG